MVHSWVNLFHLSLSRANQGGELKLTFFFPFLSPGWVFFLGTFFFLTPTPAQISPTYIRLDYYLCILASSLPNLPTHLPTFWSTYLRMYLYIKSPPRQWWCRSLKVLQYTRKVVSFSFLPTSLLNHVTLWLWKTMLQWLNWRHYN
jgi:hypothetical protein